MFGLDFKRPDHSPKLQAAWGALHRLNFGVFGQMIIIPLIQDHRILAQVAGYHTEVIKFLPPLVVTREQLDQFLDAMQKVLQNTLHVPGAAWNTVLTLAKGATRILRTLRGIPRLTGGNVFPQERHHCP